MGLDILIGQCQAVNTAAGRRADLRHVKMALPKPLGVYFRVRCMRHGRNTQART
jgi:hypothetical protein